MTVERRETYRSKRRSSMLASAWIALFAVVYAPLSPVLAAAVLGDRPAALARMLGLPHEAAIATYPRVVATRSNLLVAWTETAGNETRLRMLLMK